MELLITPADLRAAAYALGACSARLDDARATFARAVQSDLPEVGADIVEATARGTVLVERAVEIISTDIDRLAGAFAALAHHYPQVDSTAVSGR
jgi:hypothetical protein